MANFVNICGPVVANTFYCEGKLVARDVAITLPEVTPMTADLAAMGTYTVPVWQLLDNMEAAVTKVGVDMGLRSMIKPEPMSMEARWVQTVTDANGSAKNAGCKAFIKGVPMKIPGIGVNVGEASEGEVTFSVSRYGLFVDGVEMFLVDRLAGIVRIGGKDYAGNIGSML